MYICFEKIENIRLNQRHHQSIHKHNDETAALERSVKITGGGGGGVYVCVYLYDECEAGG